MPRQGYTSTSRTSNLDEAQFQAGFSVKSRAAPGKRKEEENKARRPARAACGAYALCVHVFTDTVQLCVLSVSSCAG